MASFIGALESYNPYVQQIPTDAYVKVGMFKEQEYQAGVKRVQDTIDNIAGLDIANEGGRQYLRARVDELTKSLNKYSAIDFSNVNNVSQLVGLAKPLYQDENIVTDVINTGVYRKWYKQATEKVVKGDMDAVQFQTEQAEAAEWLNSKSAGSAYTGRITPNDSTYEKINKKFLDFKSKLKPDTKYTTDEVWVYGKKSYRTSELKELFYNQMLDANDREMLSNNTSFQDSYEYGLDPNNPKKRLLDIYASKRDANTNELTRINLILDQYKGDKDDPDYKDYIRDREVVTNNIAIYNKTIASFNQADPTKKEHKQAIYNALSAEYYKDALDPMFEFEELEPKYREDVKQARDHKNAIVNSSINNTTAYGQLKDANGKLRWNSDGSPVMGIIPIQDEEGNPMKLANPNTTTTTVDANGNIVTTTAPKTGKAANPLTSLLKGEPGEQATFDIADASDIVSVSYDILNKEYEDLDGSIQQNILAMTQAFRNTSSTGFKVEDYYTIENVPGADGQMTSTINWKSGEKRKEFMGYVDMMMNAYQIEKSDGNKANKSFTRFVTGELDATAKELGLESADPNIIKELLTLKGNTPVISMMDEMFRNQNVTANLEAIDSAAKQKRDIVLGYKNILSLNAKNEGERAKISGLTDAQIMSLRAEDKFNLSATFGVPQAVVDNLSGNTPIAIKYTPNGDGTYTATGQLGYVDDWKGQKPPTAILSRNVPAKIAEDGFKKEWVAKWRKNSLNPEIGNLKEGEFFNDAGKWFTKNIFEGGDAEYSLGGSYEAKYAISSETVKKANKALETQFTVMKQNVKRTTSLLNLPENKQDKDALKSNILLSLTGQGGSKIITDPTVFITDHKNVTSITDITDIVGASTKAVGNLFNPAGFLTVKYKYKDKEGKEHEGIGEFNIDRMIATDPEYASKYSKYFAGLKYAKEGAAIRLHTALDPTYGSQSYSGGPESSNKSVSPSGTAYTDPKNVLGQDFTDYTLNTTDGHKVPISYRVISYGKAKAAGQKAKSINDEAPDLEENLYGIMLQWPTSSGKVNIYLKDNSGNNVQFNTPEMALYSLKDMYFKNLPLDNKSDAITDVNGKKVVNPFVDWNENKPSLRGFINLQFKLNNRPIPTMEELKEEYIKIAAGKASEFDKKLLQFSPAY